MNESLEYAILHDNYKPTNEEIKKLADELGSLKFKLKEMMYNDE